MAVKTRIDSIATDINLFVSRDLSPAAQSRAIATYSQAEILKADEKNRRVLGRIPPKVTTVDGRRGATLDSVNPVSGSIITEWELVTDVLVWISEKLRERSPVLTGAYRDAHTLFADGTEIDVGADIPSNVSEFTFLNPLPYSRRIEVGKTTTGRDFVISVPNRIYERTAADASKRFGNIATIKMTYRAPFRGSILSGTGSRGRSAVAKRERELRVPAIVVTLKGK